MTRVNHQHSSRVSRINKRSPRRGPDALRVCPDGRVRYGYGIRPGRGTEPRRTAFPPSLPVGRCGPVGAGRETRDARCVSFAGSLRSHRISARSAPDFRTRGPSRDARGPSIIDGGPVRSVTDTTHASSVAPGPRPSRADVERPVGGAFRVVRCRRPTTRTANDSSRSPPGVSRSCRRRPLGPESGRSRGIGRSWLEFRKPNGSSGRERVR